MKPTMKKWLTGLLSVALLAGNLPVYAVNTAYAAEEDGFFTDEAESFEGSLEEPEENPDGGQSEDSFASVSEFTGFTSGEAEEDFSGERILWHRIPRMGLKAKRIPRLFWNPICRMRAATFRT